ncbi:MAG TPA: TspO/MBR family protein [Pseudogracilibacillus sp.]|nr:TspO/MBR family protein [Pseudogracilibacillus sp.]
MRLLKLILRVGLALVGGSLVGKFAMNKSSNQYEELKQPPLSPPGIVFPIVWSALYAAMGIAYHIVKESKANKDVSIIYYTQLGLNYLWSFLYFKFRLRGLALIEVFTLLASVILTTVRFYEKNKVAGLMLIPYICWVAFATYLNAGGWYLNREKSCK